MAKYCPMCDAVTNCTDHCKECAKEVYDDLKAQVGKADYMSEDGIKSRVGETMFDLLKQYGFIETCGVLEGTKIYAL
jgi:hypothetical protein